MQFAGAVTVLQRFVTVRNGNAETVYELPNVVQWFSSSRRNVQSARMLTGCRLDVGFMQTGCLLDANWMLERQWRTVRLILRIALYFGTFDALDRLVLWKAFSTNLTSV